MTTTATTSDRTAASIATVERFLDALERGEVDAAAALLTEDAVWVNVGLPTVRGRDAIVRLLRRVESLPGAAFTVEVHNVAGDGDVVLTERTDGLFAGPVGAEFWVCGTFELRDGRIAVWRDRFDTVDVLRGMVRGTLRGLATFTR